MNDTVSTINDMHVIVDLSGPRRPTTIAADLARQLDAHLTGVALAFEPVVPVYTMTTPLPTDLIVAAHEQAVSDAKQAAAAFEQIACRRRPPLCLAHHRIGRQRRPRRRHPRPCHERPPGRRPAESRCA